MKTSLLESNLKGSGTFAETIALPQRLHRIINVVKYGNALCRPEAGEFVAEIIDLLLRDAFALSENRKTKSDLIKQMYGSSDQLGYIFPTEWPSVYDRVAKSIVVDVDISNESPS